MQDDYFGYIEQEPVIRQCEAHKRYQAKRQPRLACEACWRMWIGKNP